MSFAWPHLLYLLILPAALLVSELRRRRHRLSSAHPKILQAEAGQNKLSLKATGTARTGRARLWLYLGLIFAVIALARPQWGRLEEPVFDQSREILIAVDLSRSMLAQDVKPSRLDRAKLLISSLLEKLDGERVGLVVFSGTAFLQSPLSADYEILREFLPSLNPDYLPEGGTNYRSLLETALQAFQTSGSADRFFIVLSDGEATDDNWHELVEKLQKKNIRVISLGIGTSAGAMIPDGAGAFVKDDRGAVVLSKLGDSTLQQLATETNGIYRDASSWIDLASLIKQTVDAGRKGEFVNKHTVRLIERYQWALVPALFCLLMSFWWEFPVRPRPRALKITRPQTAALLLFALLLTTPHPTSAAEPAAKAELTALGKIVSRLATQESKTGRDWAELARETVTWGHQLQTEKQTVPEGPVRDALLAVKHGSQLDPQTADWDTLRTELEALLKNPEDQKKQDQQDQSKEDQQQDQKKDQQDQNKPKDGDQQDQQSSKQDQKKSDDASQQKKQDQQSSDQKESQDQKSDQSKDGSDPQKQDEKKSAFGDMKEKATPPPQPPPQGEMQKVGGAPQKGDASPQTDPALAMPLQKLQEIKNQDSPAKLFQMMEGKPDSSAAPKGKTW